MFFLGPLGSSDGEDGGGGKKWNCREKSLALPELGGDFAAGSPTISVPAQGHAVGLNLPR